MGVAATALSGAPERGWVVSTDHLGIAAQGSFQNTGPGESPFTVKLMAKTPTCGGIAKTPC